MAVVTFDPAAFRARYPEFSAVSDTLLDAYFTEASLYCDNTDNSPVCDPVYRAVLLNMIVAHIATLNGQNANLPSAGQTVGRLSSATEGTVSAGLSMDNQPVTTGAAFWQQTQYGAQFWQLSSRFRRFRLRAFISFPAPPAPGDPVYPQGRDAP